MRRYLFYFLPVFLLLSGPARSADIADISEILPPKLTYHTLTVNAQGGKVVSEPSGINCSNSICTYSFVEDTYVALAAVAGQNLDQTDMFLDWEGDCSGPNEACRIKMTEDRSVTAIFGAVGRPAALFTLTVNVGGAGPNVRVVSDPAGIDCSADDVTCSADFSNLEAVALSAVSHDVTNGLVSNFIGWTGDCTSSNTACVVSLPDSNKTVNANYTIVNQNPAFAKALPTGANRFYQQPRVEGSVAQVDNILPFGLGESGRDFKVKLPVFAGPVDIYLGLTIEGNDDVFLFNSSNNLVLLSGGGLVAWKSGHNGAAVDETIISNLAWELLGQSVYNFYVMVTPAGSTDDYYLWKSYRNNYYNVGNPFLD